MSVFSEITTDQENYLLQFNTDKEKIEYLLDIVSIDECKNYLNKVSHELIDEIYRIKLDKTNIDDKLDDKVDDKLYDVDLDPELLKELDKLKFEENVRDLYWQLTDYCKEKNIPLFDLLLINKFHQWIESSNDN